MSALYRLEEALSPASTNHSSVQRSCRRCAHENTDGTGEIPCPVGVLMSPPKATSDSINQDDDLSDLDDDPLPLSELPDPDAFASDAAAFL